jgi:hypothetical protein
MLKEIVQCSHCNGAIAPDAVRCDWCGYYFKKPDPPKSIGFGDLSPDTWSIHTTASMVPAFEPIMSMWDNKYEGDISPGEPVRATPNGVGKFKPEMKISIVYPSELEKKPGEFYSMVIPVETVEVSRSSPEIRYRTFGGRDFIAHTGNDEISGTLLVRGNDGRNFYHRDFMFDVNVDGSKLVGCKATRVENWMNPETMSMNSKIEFVALNYVSGYDSRREGSD